MNINRKQLEELLRNTDTENVPIILVTSTVVQMRKTGNPYIGARKVSQFKGILNFTYKEDVNNQRYVEGKRANFRPADNPWGVRVGGTPLYENKGKLYLEVKVEECIEHAYVSADGARNIDEGKLLPFMPQKDEGSRQKLEEPIIYRRYSLESIEGFVLHGKKYVVT